jgi:hypothetical protein
MPGVGRPGEPGVFGTAEEGVEEAIGDILEVFFERSQESTYSSYIQTLFEPSK